MLRHLFTLLEKNWIRVIKSHASKSQKHDLASWNLLLYLPITRSFHHQSLDDRPPLLLFIYSFIHSFYPSSSHSVPMSLCYEPALLQAQGITREPGGNGLCHQMANQTLFLLWQFGYLGISHSPIRQWVFDVSIISQCFTTKGQLIYDE